MRVEVSLLIFAMLFAGAPVAAMHHTGHGDHGGHGGHGDAVKEKASSKMKDGGVYKHSESTGDITGSFQVMSLASMKMKDPDGKTHHVMASYMKDKKRLTDVAGTITVVAPSGKEQSGTLVHFGGGIYAVNFTFDEPGEWRIKNSFSLAGKEYTKEFTYPHS